MDASVTPSGISKRSGVVKSSTNMAGTSRLAGSQESLVSNRSMMSNATCLGCQLKHDKWSPKERCFVGGIKAGRVAFVGGTQFAGGEWIGVILEEPQGKNDGSVSGVRYFDCKPKHGLFTRANRLSRRRDPDFVPCAHGGLGDGGSIYGSQFDLTSTSTVLGALRGKSEEATPSGTAPLRPSTVKTPPPGGLADAAAFTASTPLAGSKTQSDELNVGDRVVVNGKYGTLRYLGEAEFAQGVWAGVELDQPMGKNDGSVQGKRYFSCKPRYGLFAPQHKTDKASSVPRTPTTAAKLPVRHTKASALRQRTTGGSHESLSSVGSFTGSSRKRSSVTDGKELTPAAITALQDSMKEKEQHIDQLMRERDIERTEMAKLAQNLEKAEQQLADALRDTALSQTDLDARHIHLEQALTTVEQQRHDLSELYDEEKRKCEDLQFRVEEESIAKMELDSKVKELQANMVSSDSSKVVDDIQLTVDATQLTQLRQQLEKEISERDRLLSEEKNTEMELREKLLQMETTLDTAVKDRINLEKKLETLKTDMESMSTALTDRTKTAEESGTKLTEQQTLSAQLENTIKELNAKLETTEKQWHTTVEEHDRLKVEKQTLEKSLAESSGASTEQLKLMSNKDEQIDQLDAIRKELEEKLQSTEERLRTIQSDVETERSSHQQQLDTMLADTKQKEEQLVIVGQSMSELQQQIVDATRAAVEDKQRLDMDLTQVQLGLDAKAVRVAEMEAALDKASNDLCRATDEKQEWAAERRNLQIQIDALEEAQKMAADQLAKQIADEKEQLSTQLRESQAECARIEKERLESENAVLSLQGQKDRLEIDCQQLQNKVDASESEVVTLKSGATVLETRLVALTNELETTKDCSGKEIVRLKEEHANNQNQLTGRISELEAELVANTNKLALANTSQTETAEALLALQSEIKEVSTKLLASEASLKTSMDENSQLQKTLADTTVTMKKMEDTLSKSMPIEEHQNEILRLETAHKATADELEARLGLLHKEKEGLDVELTNAKSLISEKDANTKDLRTKFQASQSDNSTMKAETERLSGEVKRLEADIESMKLQQHLEADGLAQQLTAEKDKLNALLKDSETSLSCVKSELETCKATIETMSVERDKMQGSFADTKAQLEVQQRDVKCLQEERINWEKTKTELEAKIGELDNSIRSNFSKHSEIVANLETELQTKSEQLAGLAETLEGDKGELTVQLETSRAELTAMSEQLGNLQKQHQSVTEEKDMLVTKSAVDLSALNEQIESLKSEQKLSVDNFTVQLNEAKEKYDALNLEKESLAQELTNILTKLSVLSSEADSLKAAHAVEVEAYASQLKEAHDKLRVLNDEQSSSFKELTDKIAALTAEVESEKAEKTLCAVTQAVQLSDSQEQIKQLAAELAALQDSRTQWEEEKARLTTELQTSAAAQQLQTEAHTLQLNEQAEQLNARVKANDEAVESMKAERDSCEQQRLLAVQQSEQLIAEHKTKEEQLTKLNEDMVGLRMSIEGEKKGIELLVQQGSEIQSQSELRETQLREELQSKTSHLSLLEADQQQLVVDNTKNRTQLESANSSIDELKLKVCELESALTTAQQNTTVLEKERQQLKNNLDTATTSSKATGDELSSQLVSLQSQLAAVSSEKEALVSEKTQSQQSIEEYKNKLASLQTEYDSSQSTTKEEISKLQMEVEHLKSDAEHSQRVREILKKLEHELKAVKDQSTEKEIQLKRLTDEKLMTESTILQLQQTNATLVEGMDKMRASTIGGIDSATSSSTTTTSSDVELQQQINFLNSVIADQRKKNADLLARIEMLQELPPEALRNGISARMAAAPRVYCDICEEFDLHDTEDCPTQAQDEQDLAGHTKNNAGRYVERPYCDNCEMFGHVAVDCENGTF